MRNLVVILSFVLFSNLAFSQNKEFDKLEMYYSQGHYSLVFKRSNALLNMPDYDYSMIPSFYKGLSIFQLAQNNRRYKKDKYNVDMAAELLLKVKNSADGKKIFESHADELKNAKRDLMAWAADVKLKGDEKKYLVITTNIKKIFENVEDYPTITIPKAEIVEKEKLNKDLSVQRQELLVFAKKYIGTPYKSGGTEPSGFDCSGYVSFVLNNQQISLPRRSHDQFVNSIKLKEKNVQPGDLVFFSNGGDVTHVGMVYLIENGIIYMIHSSTSKGIEIADITNSSYWSKRIHGYGTYIK